MLLSASSKKCRTEMQESESPAKDIQSAPAEIENSKNPISIQSVHNFLESYIPDTTNKKEQSFKLLFTRITTHMKNHLIQNIYDRIILIQNQIKEQFNNLFRIDRQLI